MAATVSDSRSVGSQAGLPSQNEKSHLFSWFSKTFDSSSKSLNRASSSSSSTSSTSAERGRSSESFARSASATSTSSSSRESDSAERYSRVSSSSSAGFRFGKDYVPDKSEMKIVFEKFDENKDGKICGKDLHRFMNRLGVDMSLEEAKSMLKTVDHNSDGCVDFEEFFSLYLSLSGDVGETDEAEAGEEEDDDTLLQVFQVFDRNGDGVITPQELQEVLNQLGIPEGKDIRNCKKMIQRVDSNGDELIDINEFKLMMSSSCFQDE